MASVVELDARSYPMEGKALQVVVAKDDHSFELNEDVLAEVLLRPDVRNKKVVVVSVAGAFRKGKSFLLDFFLRYLNRRDAAESWMGEETEKLEGFHWRGGTTRDTMGILMWSEPFFRTLPTGEEVAVLLLDTQGAFDNQSTVKDCATVFALSTMISSVQVYNISQMIREDDLQHLQLFTEYGRLAMEQSNVTPFQILHFLVRDWSFSYEFENGSKGGEEYLEKTLKITDSQHEQLKGVREHIRTCFEQVSCFLLPHPGLKVATQKDFEGHLQDIDIDFQINLKQLIPSLLSADRLVVKKINGSKVTGSDMMEYFRAYMKIYQGEDLPEPRSMLEATAEANNLAAVNAAMDLYRSSMSEICGPSQPFISPTDLEGHHEQHQAAALQLFRSTRKMGGNVFSRVFEEQLSKQIAEAYDDFAKSNSNKNVFSAARTPATLVVIIILAHIVSYLLDFLYLTKVDQMVDLMWWITVLMLAAWSYVRYSGQYREVGNFVDSTAEFIWDQFLCEAYALVAGKMFAASLPGVKKTKKD